MNTQIYPSFSYEEDVDYDNGSRNYRWWEAYRASGGGSTTTLPEAMVNSGHQVADGSVTFPNASTDKFYNLYKSMVDAELSRPPEADIDAFAERVDDRVRFSIWVTNRSSRPLYAYKNLATVNAIVYEDTHVLLTDRFVRAAEETALTPELAPYETSAFQLETPELSGVDWDKLHSLAFVDYQPGDGAYDIVQAAVPGPPDFWARPESITLMIDSTEVLIHTIDIDLRGTLDLDWAAEETLTWLDVAPFSASILNPPVVSIYSEKLIPGWQHGELSITAESNNGIRFIELISVQVYLGPVEELLLPMIGQE